MSAEVQGLICAWGHVLLWPADLLPYPDECPHRIDAANGRCHQAMNLGQSFEPVRAGLTRCTDGSIVHDFQGRTHCAFCGISGITAGATA